MNRSPLFRLVCVVCMAFATVVAQAATPPGNVTVHYKDPANFSEAKLSVGIHLTDTNAYLKPLKEYIADRASRVLAPGQRMEIEVTDVKRAGEYEPWRGPRFDDVRIIKDIYPPRIDLNFTVYDTDGKVLNQGSRKLRDAAFLTRGVAVSQEDPLRYEKGLINLWLGRGEAKL